MDYKLQSTVTATQKRDQKAQDGRAFRLDIPSAIALCLFTALLVTARPGEPASVDLHVPTGVYCCHGYANDSVASSAAAPYVTWASADATGAKADHQAGIQNVYRYIDVSAVYNGDHAYPLIAGGPLSAARALNCSGQPIEIASHNGGFLTDPSRPETVKLLDQEITYEYDPAFTAYFVDDIDAYRYVKNGPPCSGNPPAPWREPAAAQAYASMLGGVSLDIGGRTIVPEIVVNALSVFANQPALHTAPLGVLTPANVLGGMCEDCYGSNTPDAVKGGAEWQDDEDLEIQTIRIHKLFWDYVRYIANVPAARIYTFASFMLAWNPQYSVYQTAYKPDVPGQLHVTPETGIVAYEPVKTQVGSVNDLRDAGGTYVREYRTCYYRRAPIGSCAFIVNSDNVAHSAPHLAMAYRHTVTVAGGMVLEGGTVSTNGPAMPQTIGPTTALIATR
jgi:hypothetical protein